MHRRLPVLALTSLLCLASACERTGDLTGPDAAQPTSPRFSEVDGNGGTIGNGNFTGSGVGTLGSGGRTVETDPDASADVGGPDGSGGAVANSEDNGGTLGSGG